MLVIQGCTSPETGHLSVAYPFGRSIRCIRREWIEKAEKGANKGLYRFVTQTTTKPFNIVYTSMIEREGQEAADTWARAEIAAGRASWNATKPSTYNHLSVMVEAPLEDGSGRIGVDRAGLHLYCGPQRLTAFKRDTDGQLNDEQRARLALLEEIDRKASPTSWARGSGSSLNADGVH